MPRIRATRLSAIAQAARRFIAGVFEGSSFYALRIPEGSTYSGPLTRLRSSGGAEQDIGAATVAQTRQNVLPNPTGSGAVVGGSFPTNWTFAVTNGITPSVTGLGVEGGQAYVEVRFTGTATATASIRNVLGFVSMLPAQQVVSAVGIKLQAGTTAGTTAINLRNVYRNSSNGFISSTSIPLTIDGSMMRFGMSRVTPALTARLDLELEIALTAGAVVDLTCRFFLPNAEVGRRINVQPLTSTNETVVAPVGSLDVNAIESFLGDTNGTCVTLYDQSALAQHATQSVAANQPFLVSSAVLFTIAGVRPALRFNAALGHFLQTPSRTQPALMSVSGVVEPSAVQSAVTPSMWLGTTVSGNFAKMGYTTTGDLYRWATRSINVTPRTYTSDVATIRSAVAASNAVRAFSGGQLAGEVASAPVSYDAAIIIGSTFDSQHWNGDIAEVVIFDKPLLDSERLAVERNQGAYYQISTL